MKKFLLLLFWATCCIPIGSQAQQASKKVTLEGTVTEFNSKEPLAGCVVSIPTLELWVVTDAKGRFKMPSVTTGSYSIEASCLGYEPLSYQVTVSASILNLNLRMKESSLQLNTVTVTAKKGPGINSSSTIDRQAMDHLQATSVKDVMQLLPGVLTSNPDLTNSANNFIGIRDINTNITANTANGLNSNTVGVYVDGAVVNNDASIVGNNATSFAQTLNKGIDMRTLSTDNIESVEVIRGVASAEYGNMSAGAVVVKTKKGRTPYEVRVKTVPNTKAVAMTKGYEVGNGFLNVALDYANAANDIRTSKDTYDRGTFSLDYSNTFNRDRTPLSFSAKLSGYLSDGTSKPDADNASKAEREESRDRSLGLNIDGSWLLNKPWITALRYTVNSTMTREYARSKTASSYVNTANPGSTEEGEYLVEFTPSPYMTDVRNLSMAYYTNAKLVAELSGRYGKVYNKAMLGFEWNNSGNTGRGTYCAGDRPIGFRPEKFSDIPFINRLAAFAEEKVTLPIGKTSFTLQAGGRFMSIQTSQIKKNWTIDPRFNVKYTIISNRSPKAVREISVRAGWGIQTTMPSLRLLYPFPIYDDASSFAWRNASGTPISAYTTMVTTRDELRNRDLKLQHSKNFEAGLDFDIFGVKGSVAYFNEKMRDGYSTQLMPSVFTYREYDTYTGTNAPQYVTDGSGKKVLSGDNGALTYKEAKIFKTAGRPSNSSQYDKWGVEYTLDFGQIEPIRTSILVNGAYMKSKNRENVGETVYGAYQKTTVKLTDNSTIYNPYIAAYNNGSTIYSSTNRERFNSNVSFITHIPKLRLITSLTVQCVWLDRSGYNKNNNVYFNEENQRFYRDPDYYMDAATGTVLPFNPNLYADPVYGTSFDKYRLNSIANYFLENSFKPYFMANIRITKEIGKLAQISFYANNFTNSRPKMKLRSSGSTVQVNTEMYFGAELKLKF